MAQHAKLDGLLKQDAGWKGVERMRESMDTAMSEATRGGVMPTTTPTTLMMGRTGMTIRRCEEL